MLKRQIKELPLAMADVERTRYAHEANKLLVQVAKARNGPLVADLSAIELAFTGAFSRAQTERSAATGLDQLSDPDAQRSLANLILDPSRPTSLWRQSTSELVHSIQRFGRLISASQEARLTSMLHEDDDSEFRDSVEAVIRALNPAKTKIGVPHIK
jgi:hypothetical protein